MTNISTCHGVETGVQLSTVSQPTNVLRKCLDILKNTWQTVSIGLLDGCHHTHYQNRQQQNRVDWDVVKVLASVSLSSVIVFSSRSS